MTLMTRIGTFLYEFWHEDSPRTAIVNSNVDKMFISFHSYGKTWTRLAPHQEIIPLGAAGAFDSHTCYAAPPMLDPMNPKTTLLYYAGTLPPEKKSLH